MARSKDVVANVNNFKEKHGIKGIIFALVIVVLVAIISVVCTY